MERRLVAVEAVAILIAGTLLHFTYPWSGKNALVGFLSPINESVWEHTKLLVVPVIALAAVEVFLISDRRRVAWAALAESVAGAVGIIAIFYTYTGALGLGPVLWVDIASFVLVVIAGQFVKGRILLTPSTRTPALSASVAALAVLVGLYVAWTVAPPDLPLFRTA